ncbi:MAG: type VII secretion protein EccCa [Angustibacter sp.]
MSVRVHRRPPRQPLPELPRGDVQMQPPPNLPRGGNQNMGPMLMMLPMMIGMGAMSFSYIGKAGGPMVWVFGILFGGMIIAMVVMMARGSAGQNKKQINDERRDYLRYLANTRVLVTETAKRQRGALLAAQPEPQGLVSVVTSSRLWERQNGDRDAFQVRIGRGPQLLATSLQSPQTPPLEDLDPVASTSLRHFMRTYSTVQDLPVAVAARSFAQVVLLGERGVALGLARALLANLASFHSPQDLRIAVLAAPDRQVDWDWLKWLPHTQHPFRQDASGWLRLVATTTGELEDLLDPEPADRPRFTAGPVPGANHPQLVIVLDVDGVRPGGALLGEGGLFGVTLLDVTGSLPRPSMAPQSELRLVVEPDRMGVVGEQGPSLVGRPDQLDEVSARALAQRLSAIQVVRVARGTSALNTNFGLPELLGIGDPRTLDTEVTWRPRSPRERLRIPLGLDPDGQPVELDLKESAEGGMGPHGLIIGATGSGKSELLRTLVIGVAAMHSSQNVNLVLVDFKGGATFAGLGTLPHTSAVITNLADDLTLVDRMKDALEGELVRRQELLKAAGNYASVRDYERARESGAELMPLPTLLVIIDEFSELLTSKPDFIDVFVMIGRLGRSLGVHLMLASQRLEEGRLRGLDSHLSFRIGLRTFSAGESRTVLGVPDAYELPSVPGSAFLRVDTTTLIRFKSAYVSGVLPPLGGPVGPSGDANRRIEPFSARSSSPELVADDEEAKAEAEAATGVAPAVMGDSVLEAMVARLEGQGPPAHQVWLPPLSTPPSLDQVLPPLGATQDRGLCPVGWGGNGTLTAALGIVDKPFEQRRDVLWANLAGAAGNLAVIGGPRTGKSTLLRSLIASMALTHRPSEVQFYCLDFGGGALAGLRDLPHVGGVADRQDDERCRRVVATMLKLLADREVAFREQGIDSVEEFRRRCAGKGDAEGYGDVFLVVDGWLTLKQEFEELEEAVVNLAIRGLGYGIHVVVSGNRWWDIRMQARDALGTRFELRLGDPSDSEIDRKAAANVPVDSPGRGINAQRQQFLLALPRIDSSAGIDDLPGALAGFVQAVRQASPALAPELGVLPRHRPASDLPTDGPFTSIPIGWGESDLGVRSLDLTAETHLVVYGDAECGKTNLLRLILNHITSRTTPDQVRVFVADYRRTLIDSVDHEHVLSYTGSEKALAEDVRELVKSLEARLPGPEVTAEQLRTRSWWSGPRVLMLVDDYDLVSAASDNPLLPLVPLLGQSRDIDFHLIVTRRAGGAGRAMFDPVLGRIRELGSSGMMMSGPRDEGVLIGDVKPSTQPPGRGWLVRRKEGKELIQLAATMSHQ